MSRISTGTGDDGTTALLGGDQVPKTDPRVEAYGAVDEANDILGVAAAHAGADLEEEIQTLQSDLLTVGADLANPEADHGQRVDADDVERLEARIDELEADLPELERFILPGGTQVAAFLQLARSTVRRAERLGWRLDEDHDVNRHVLVYLNRLSDLLFLLARAANQEAGVEDEQWVGGD